MGRHSVFIAGAGGIGSAVALLLRELPKDFFPDFQVDIYLSDIISEKAKEARAWILKDSNNPSTVEVVEMGNDSELNLTQKKYDVVLDCTPGAIAPQLARFALENNCHYANLTEYDKETNEIKKIALNAKTGFILQTGLAPGFINILAHSLFQSFCVEHQVDKVDSVSMKVGALTKHALPPHYYGFTWSPIGVATEYVEPAIVIRNFKKQQIASLSARAPVIINGITYVEDLTSGGAADLPEALEGKAMNLDYKTLRHIGHYEWIDSLLSSLPENGSKAIRLQTEMEAAVPLVKDDFILIYASVQGKDNSNKLHVKEKVHYVEPIEIGGKKLRAIQATTAASLAECAKMLLDGKHQGVVLQSKINCNDFLGGAFVSKVYGC